MAISGDKYPFTQENVDRSPTDKGVYALYDEDVTIYIGEGGGENGIRERLQYHKRGGAAPCTKGASHYRKEVCSNPATRKGNCYRNTNGFMANYLDAMM